MKKQKIYNFDYEIKNEGILTISEKTMKEAKNTLNNILKNPENAKLMYVFGEDGEDIDIDQIPLE